LNTIEHDDVIKSLLRGALRLGLALGPASARAGPAHRYNQIDSWTIFSRAATWSRMTMYISEKQT